MARVSSPAEDLDYKVFEYEGQEYRLLQKFKMLKFFKTLQADPVAALELVVHPDDFARLEDVDMSMDDFKNLLEAVSNALSGTDTGN